jgi:amino-acid N-acetyltransferase
MGRTIGEQVELIREVFLYAQRFMGSTFVVQIGSELLSHPSFPSLVQDIALLHKNKIRIVAVPGAASRIDELLAQNGIECAKKDGVRISSPEAMPLIVMAAFDVANRLMTELATQGIDALIGNWARAKGLGVRNGIDYQSTGSVERINVEMIGRVLDDGFLPILPCVGWSGVGKPYNISSHELAAALAAQLKAEKLFFVTEDDLLNDQDGPSFSYPQEGVSAKDGRVSRLSSQAAARFVELNESRGYCIERELIGLAAAACANGVERVHFVDGTEEGAVLQEVFSSFGSGVMVHADPFENIKPMRPADFADALRIMEPYMESGALKRRTEEDLARELDSYYVFEADGKVRGTCALRPFGSQAEVAAIAVDAAYAQLGIGQKMVRFLIEKGRERGYSGLFLLTTHTADWFEGLGFKPGPVDSLPEAKLAEYDRTRMSKAYFLRYGA